MHPILADFLRTELRDGARLGERLLADIDDIRTGRRETGGMTGNLYTVSLTAGGALIENLFDETQRLELDLGTLSDAVRARRSGSS